MSVEEEPGLDYWMVPVLREAISRQMMKATKGYNAKYIEREIRKKNPWNPIGQLQIISEKLNDIQLFKDEMIKRGLEIHRRAEEELQRRGKQK